MLDYTLLIHGTLILDWLVPCKESINLPKLI